MFWVSVRSVLPGRKARSLCGSHPCFLLLGMAVLRRLSPNVFKKLLRRFFLSSVLVAYDRRTNPMPVTPDGRKQVPSILCIVHINIFLHVNDIPFHDLIFLLST